ncbi:MAG: hypothetical protein CFE28_05040 [Alphaproteobacteria bacterium PA2]|nr:MAG: hypothetical protein CFE28_05040 [Alphaproteobacteria bacterium PA2]
MAWSATAPLLLVSCAIFVLLLAALELGYRIPVARRRKDSEGLQSPDYLLSAVLGLLALLLGFTFSLALERYESRRDLVMAEANAIGTSLLRADLLQEPLRSDLVTALGQYVEARISWSLLESHSDSVEGTASLQRRIWTMTGQALRSDPEPQITRGLMESLNESFDLAATRAETRRTHLPERLLGMLLLYVVLSAVMLGYVLESGGQRHRGPATVLLILLTIAITLILDVDRPLSGGIRVSQQPMLDLRASLPAIAASTDPAITRK